jgi:hypothetical protein
MVYTIEKYSGEFDRKLKNAIENLSDIVSSTGEVKDAERKGIVCVMGCLKRHWYKCPNEHICVITECLGAMEKTLCYECGEATGGSNHRLLASNSVATEMDGATHPAWPQ